MNRETTYPNGIRLGSLTYRIAEKRLEDQFGREVFLRPQSALVLELLAKDYGTVVTKDRLIDEVWPNVSVTDDSLTQCIADIRRAISDKERLIIRTIPKTGFLLNPSAPILDADDGDASRRTLVGTRNNDGDGEPGTFDVPLVYVLSEDIRRSAEPPNGQGPKGFLDNLEKILRAHSDGRILETPPYGALIAFSNMSAALRFAMAASAISTGEVPGARNYRIGVDLMVRGGWVGQGDRATGGQDRVKNLAQLATGGQVIVSVDVRDRAYSELSIEFEDLGLLSDYGGDHPIRAFWARRGELSSGIQPDLSDQDVLPAIAVIPFRPRDVRDDSIMGEIIADDIIAQLARSDEVDVISRFSSAAFKTGNAPLNVLASALNADFVLSGSFKSDENLVDLQLEFAEIRSQRVIWSDRMKISVASFFMDNEAVQKIVSQIRKHIILNEIHLARTTPITGLRNYTLLASAVGLMHRLQPSDFATAGEMLQALMQRAPQYPQPLAWMARWHVLRVQQGWSDQPMHEAEFALTCCRRALEVDPENVIALTSEGLVLTNLMHRLDEAEDRYDAALEANPSDANGLSLRGMLYAFQGKGQEAKRDAERSLRLAPLDPHRFFFLSLAAGANLAAGDWQRALTLAEASFRMNRSHTSTLRTKAVAQLRLGQEEAARKSGQTLLKLEPNFRVGGWLKNSPSANYEMGQNFADALREIGIPE